MFSSVVKRNYVDILPLILNHLDTLLASLIKYFSSKSTDQYNWIRSSFIECEAWEKLFALAEEEELASVASDRTLRLKHSELNLDAFWVLVEQQYPAIAQKAQRLLVQFSTSYLSEFGFSALTSDNNKTLEARTTAVCRRRILGAIV